LVLANAKDQDFNRQGRLAMTDGGQDRSQPVAQPQRTRGPINVDIHELSRLSRSELRVIWIQELGDRPPATLGRDILALGIAYTRQQHRLGGLTKPVARELDRLLEQALRDDRTDKSSAVLSSSLPRNGTVLVREWQGTTHTVTIVKDGFLWNGSTYRSLSGIARAITGTKWNGPRFFGMREVNGKVQESRRGA
jgi:hypothetical protein